MAQHSVTPSVNAPAHLTEKEWTEIRECTSALYAVVGIFLELPGRAEIGGIETLQSVQRRLDLTVALAENRLKGEGRGECPLCGQTPPPDPDDDPSQENLQDSPPPTHPADPNKNGTHLDYPVVEE